MRFSAICGVFARRWPTWRYATVRSVFTVLSLCYSSVLRTTFTLLRCVSVQGHGRVLLIAGTVPCFTDWQILVMVLVVPLLVLYPVFLAIWIYRHDRHVVSSQQSCFGADVVRNMTLIYTDRWHLWPAVTLAERLLFVATFCFAPRPENSWLLFFLLMLCWVLHFWCQPYKSSLHLRLDLLILLNLVALAAVRTAFDSLMDSIVEHPRRRAFLDGAALFLSCGPVVCLMFVFCLPRRKKNNVELELLRIPYTTDHPTHHDAIRPNGQLPNHAAPNENGHADAAMHMVNQEQGQKNNHGTGGMVLNCNEWKR